MERKELTEKEKAIKKEVLRIKRIFKEIDKNKKAAAEGLIQEAAFMRVTLADLKAQVNENGPVDEMEQGDYSILREHPALKSYNTMVQRYAMVWKTLNDLLPKDIPKVEDDGFDNYLVSKK